MKTLFLMTGYGLAALLFLGAYAAVFLSLRGLPVYSLTGRRPVQEATRPSTRPVHQLATSRPTRTPAAGAVWGWQAVAM